MKTIKTLCIAVIAIFMFSNASCNKKIKLEKDFTTAAVTLSANPQAAGTFDFSDIVAFDLKKTLEDNNLTLDNVTSIDPQSATITIIDGTNPAVTFDIIDKVSVELASATVTNQRVAFKDPVPHTGVKVLSPDVDPNTDVLGLVASDMITYHFKGTLNAPLTHAVQVKMEITWHVVGEVPIH